MERPEASKDSIGLGGRSTLKETNIPKRRLPLYLAAYFYQPNIVLFWAGLFGPTSKVVLVRLKLCNGNASIYTNHLDRFKLVLILFSISMFLIGPTTVVVLIRLKPLIKNACTYTIQTGSNLF